MTELESLILLNMAPELGSIRIKRLLDYFGSASKAIKAKGSELARVLDISNNAIAQAKSALTISNGRGRLK